MDQTVLQRLIIKACLKDQTFLAMVCNVLLPEYFDDPTLAKIYSLIVDYYKIYLNIPQKAILQNNDDSNIQTELDEIESLDFDLASSYQYLLDKTNQYLKDQALKNAILKSVDIINKGSERAQVRNLIDNALAKDLKVDLGLDYFATISERLRRMFSTLHERVPTLYPILDEYTFGGFPPYTLSIFGAAIHGFKSALMANMVSRQVLSGYNCAIASMEMSEDMFAQRFDALFSKRDINRIYITNQLKAHLLKKLKEISNMPNLGKLMIKQFPTGAATVLDIRNWLRELILRNIPVNIIYVDYINLMKPSYASKGDLYTDVKKISEELRALSFEFNCPVVSVTQLNREGMRIDLRDLDFTFISESIALAATADFLAIIGDDEDSRVYESEISIKISKNRLGGRVGEIIKMYYDSRTLGIYDTTELDLWLSDAQETGDERSVASQPEPEHRGRRR